MTLYLIPVPIAENALGTLPPATVEIAHRLDVFLVERPKTARHFIKSLAPPKPISEMTFAEIGKKGSAEAAEAAETLRGAARAGTDVGLLSEAGCPGIADPGASVVALAHRLGMRVVPLVGPSSLLLALMASGMNGQRFAFHGYLPPNRPELARDLKRLEQLSEKNDQTQLFIETPYRSQMVLEVALETLLPDTQFAVAQDLTGTGEFVRSLRTADWRKLEKVVLGKAPAVFLLFRGVPLA